MTRLLVLAALLFALPAGAVTFYVDSTADAPDADPGDGVCADATGACTLPAAIGETNELAGADEIRVPEGIYPIPLLVLDDLTLTGAGADRTTLEGSLWLSLCSCLFCDVCDRQGAHAVRVENLTIRGAGEGLAGIISSLVDLELVSVVVKENSGAEAGIVQIGGRLRVERSAIHANGPGPGILARIDLNCYPGLGCTCDPPTLEVANSTVSDNVGEIRVEGCSAAAPARATLVASTLAGAEGNAIEAYGAEIRLRSTLLAEASCMLHDDDSTIVSLGYNLAAPGGSCVLDHPTDLPGVDPLIGPLQDNGGPTPMHALLPGSPALDAIPLADCTYDDDGDPGTPEVPLLEDQRGEPRPFGSGCDIGAFEVPEPAHALLVLTGGLVLAAARRKRRA